MPPAKQSKLNMFHCGLNDKLIESNYSHLATKLFNNLALPPGLIVENKPTEKKLYINYSKNPCSECISDEHWDKLDKLSEVKSSEVKSSEVKASEIKANKPNKPTRKKKPTKNKKRKRSRKK